MIRFFTVASVGLRSSPFFGQRRAGLVAKTANKMIVDEACRLHVSVHNRAANKSEATLFQVLADRIRFGRRGRNIADFFETVLQRLAVDKVPDVVAKASEFFLDGNKSRGIGDRGLDL